MATDQHAGIVQLMATQRVLTTDSLHCSESGQGTKNAGDYRRQLLVPQSESQWPLHLIASTRSGHPSAIDQRLLSGTSNAETGLTIGVVGPQLLSPST